MIQNNPFFRTRLTIPATFALAVVGCSPTSEGPPSGIEQADIASAESMEACPADDGDPACPAGAFAVTCQDGSHEVATAEDIRDERVCRAAAGAKTTCLLFYVNISGCAETCPSAVVGTFTQTVRGSYPSFAQVLGSQAPQSLPYSGSVAASPKITQSGMPLRTDGYFDLGIQDNGAGRVLYSSEAEVSLSRVHQDVGSVIGGDLRANVGDFVYQDQTYDHVMLFCHIAPG